MLPTSGVSRPAMMRSSVVLPQPEGPSSAMSSPDWMSRLTSRRAWESPNCLLALRISQLMAFLLLLSGRGRGSGDLRHLVCLGGPRRRRGALGGAVATALGRALGAQL